MARFRQHLLNREFGYTNRSDYCQLQACGKSQDRLLLVNKVIS